MLVLSDYENTSISTEYLPGFPSCSLLQQLHHCCTLTYILYSKITGCQTKRLICKNNYFIFLFILCGQDG